MQFRATEFRLKTLIIWEFTGNINKIFLFQQTFSEERERSYYLHGLSCNTQKHINAFSNPSYNKHWSIHVKLKYNSRKIVILLLMWFKHLAILMWFKHLVILMWFKHLVLNVIQYLAILMWFKHLEILMWLM